MSVSVHTVLNDPSSSALDKRDGKYLVPQAIEVMFKAVCPLAGAMLVHADGRNVATALVTLDTGTLAQWERVQSLSATACVHSCGDVLNRWETITEFRILDHDLTVDDGELTPSLKVRRKGIESRSRPLLHSRYDGQRHE